MLTSVEAVSERDATLLEEEPALDIALPQVFTRPPLGATVRGQLKHVEWHVARLYRLYLHDHPGPAQTPPMLGPEYQALVNEFQPLLTWGASCWDYLLTTEGVRFLPRGPEEKFRYRGDYRAVTDRDYARLVHRVFRSLVVEYAWSPVTVPLAAFLREPFWGRIVLAYRRLSEPADPRQRPLSPYSYLRCVPYRFLHRAHQERTSEALRRLPLTESRALDAYFLHFRTKEATARELAVSPDTALELLRGGLAMLGMTNRLVYCLLRQIERY